MGWDVMLGIGLCCVCGVWDGWKRDTDALLCMEERVNNAKQSKAKQYLHSTVQGRYRTLLFRSFAQSLEDMKKDSSRRGMTFFSLETDTQNRT